MAPKDGGHMSKLRADVMILICAVCMQPPGVHGQLDSESTRSSDATNIVEKITQLEQERSKAQVQSDVSKLNQLLAPEFVEVNAAGQIRTKAENIEGHRNGQTHWQAFDLNELKVKVYGNTAVVTGRLTRTGTFAGRDLSGRSRYTRYYVNRQGHWQAIFQHSIPDPE
ncbi:MAG: hypothetical protein DMG60_13385 [Acidobacteria bacterium]|nr:MAG: hypothetical protein DMG60_13385 [Acidobacteriota bacterium]